MSRLGSMVSTMRERKIITDFVYPPIPDRRMDWCAFFDGEEENGRYGWGLTEQEAIDDLKMMAEDDAA